MVRITDFFQIADKISSANQGAPDRGEEQFDLSKYGNGIYFLNIFNGETSINLPDRQAKK